MHANNSSHTPLAGRQTQRLRLRLRLAALAALAAAVLVVGCTAQGSRRAEPVSTDQPAATATVPEESSSETPASAAASQPASLSTSLAEPAFSNLDDLAARDPRAFLERVASRCSDLPDYTLRFTRTERRGLIPRLEGPEHIEVWFRRRPFSLRMKWLNEDLKFGESVYVEGRHDNMVRFVTRWWSPPLAPPPAINRVDLLTPVLLGESKRPLTDFGLEKTMARILATLDKAGSGATLSYLGVVEREAGGPRVHHIRVEYAPTGGKAPSQDLYFHLGSGLPAGAVLRTAVGQLDAAYAYDDIRPDVGLRDEDFLLEVERGAAASEPADAPATMPAAAAKRPDGAGTLDSP